MTSSQSRYSIVAATDRHERLLAGDEWRSLAESALQPERPTMGISRFALIGIGFVLGTGAVAPAFSASITSSAPGIVISAPKFKAPKKFEALSTTEQIIAIRSLLGLNILELATILHVQRPTIYSWQAGISTPHHENASRLRYIHELAQRWSRMCAEPIGDWTRKPIDEEGRTLVALLSAEVVDEPAVNEAFAELKTKLEEDAKNFISVRERVRRSGYKERSRSKQDSSLDRETLA